MEQGTHHAPAAAKLGPAGRRKDVGRAPAAVVPPCHLRAAIEPLALVEALEGGAPAAAAREQPVSPRVGQERQACGRGRV